MAAPRLTTPEARAALSAFLAAPGRATIEPLLRACREFVLVQARSWRAAALSLQDRCREILSEMFLILMEDLQTSRMPAPDSLLGYVALRLRRLTRPHRSWAVAFGLADDLPDVGRCDFTPLRLDLVREIVGEVRAALATEPREETRRLEFLFIHVQPDLAWASRALALAAGDPVERRYETDKKRHQGFHREIRDRFDHLRSGDWRDVAAWSPGERRHLAWAIIDLSAAEAERLGTDRYQALARWREHPDLASTDPRLLGDVLPHGLQALADLHRRQRLPERGGAREPATPLFDEPDLFTLLFQSEMLRGQAVQEPVAAYGGAGPAKAPLAPGHLRMAEPSVDSPGKGRRARRTVGAISEVTAEDPLTAFDQALADILAWGVPLLERPGAARARYPLGGEA